MTGDGTNDAPAWPRQMWRLAMNYRHNSSQGSRKHGGPGFIPTKLIEIVKIGKQLLMTRGSLTTFSIANDVAKYFAIIRTVYGIVSGTVSPQYNGASQCKQRRVLGYHI